MNSRYFIVAILVFMALVSCKKDRPHKPAVLCSYLTRDLDSIQLLVQGSWKWVENRYYYTSNGEILYITPESTGRMENVAISGNRIAFYINGKVHRSKRFEIKLERDVSIWSGGDQPVLVTYDLQTNQQQAYYRVGVCNSQLIFELTNLHDADPVIFYKRH